MLLSGSGGRVLSDQTPQTIEDWWTLGQRHLNGARSLRKDKNYSLVWQETGFAVECFLKAAIIKREGWNRFPDRASRPDLFTHDIPYLLGILQVDLKALVKTPVGPKMKVLMTWRRFHGYNPAPMPGNYADQIFDAAFSQEGVVEWIMMTYRLP